MVLLITQNTHVKYQNTPKDKASFSSFLRLKAWFAYTWKLKKPEYLCGRKPKKCLSAHEKIKNWKWNYYYNPKRNIS
jgi:hypothetical protein